VKRKQNIKIKNQNETEKENENGERKQSGRREKVPEERIRGKEEGNEDEPKPIAPADGHRGMHLDSRTARSVRCVKDSVQTLGEEVVTSYTVTNSVLSPIFLSKKDVHSSGPTPVESSPADDAVFTALRDYPFSSISDLPDGVDFLDPARTDT
jgi:hypothetical protein